MTDSDLIALCVLMEAGGEIDDGKAAVARVIKNRMALKFESDGTVYGTVLKYDQFSWAWFDFVSGGYRRIAWTVDEAEKVAERDLNRAAPGPLLHCRDIAEKVMAGIYAGPLYDHLTDLAVNYLNPRILHRVPAWASPDKLVCVIGNHSFFRA